MSSDSSASTQPAGAGGGRPTHAFTLGSLNFTFSGDDDRTLPSLLSEFQPLAATHGSPSLIDFEFVQRLPEIPEAVLLSPMRISEDRYRYRGNGFEHLVARADGGLHVWVEAARSSWRSKLVPEWALRARDWNYLLVRERIAKDIIYGVFDYLTQIVHLSLSATYVHASSFEKDGRAILAAAWGGIGKTTAMLKLVAEDGWRYLSDDLALIDEDGWVWRTPKRLQIYAYNTVGQPELSRALLRDRTPLDRLAWRWRLWRNGAHHVRRRLSAEELFGSENVARRGKLALGLFLQRAETRGFHSEPLTADQFARRVVACLLHELQPFLNITTAMDAVDRHPVLPSLMEFCDTTYSVICNAVRGAPLVLVSVPWSSGPDDLASYFRELIDAHAAAAPSPLIAAKGSA